MGIQWSERLSVGVEEIDAQHRELFARVNELLEAMRERRGRDELARVVAWLADYVKEHFAAEEQLMRRSYDPALVRHLEQHEAFVRRYQELVGRLDAEGPSPGLAVMLSSHLCGWLREHVATIDRELGVHLQRAAEGRFLPSRLPVFPPRRT